MRNLILAFAAAFVISGCATTPDEPKCKHPENVFTAPVGDIPVTYTGDDGATHKCTPPGGHCKGATYNGCSKNADLCCTKE